VWLLLNTQLYGPIFCQICQVIDKTAQGLGFDMMMENLLQNLNLFAKKNELKLP